MFPKTIFERAPLGALIHYSDGRLRPPDRFHKKLAAWKQSNASGRLVKKARAVERPTYSSAAGFTLHEGDFGSGDTIVLSVFKSFSIDSSLNFEIVEEPAPGSVRILTSFQGADELVHLAPDVTSAQAWLAAHGYPGARLEVVGQASPDGADGAVSRAA